jgi:hypothetical protein
MSAKVFGGARMFDDLQNIGGNNAAFTERFLRDEGIPIIASSLGGRAARRIHHRPATGRALVRAVEDADAVQATERKRVRAAAVANDGSVELFLMSQALAHKTDVGPTDNFECALRLLRNSRGESSSASVFALGSGRRPSARALPR